MKYKEGFSRGLVEQLIGEVRPQSVLDPFSGIGTTPLIAAGQGLRAAGIEIIPVGVLVGNAIAHAANGLESDEFRVASESLLKRVDCPSEAHEEYAFPHVRITESAFPPETESGLAKAREFINSGRRSWDSGHVRGRLHERPWNPSVTRARTVNTFDGTFDQGAG